MQVADPVTEPAQQRGDGVRVLAADRRPVGVDLEEHGLVQRVREHLKAGPAGDRGELEGVVVVAEAQAPVRRPGGGLVEVTGERGDRRGAGEARRRDRRHDHRVRADRLAPSSSASASWPRARACTEQTASPAWSRSARSASGSVITSYGSTAP